MMGVSLVKDRAKQLLEIDSSYREEIEFVQNTIADSKVFIGQSQSGPTDKPDHVYWVSVGMFQCNLPEVVMCSVPAQIARLVVDDLVVGTDFDREFLAGQRTKVIYGFEVMAVPIDKPEDHTELWVIRDYYSLTDKPQPKVVQLVFADSAGRYPWHKDSDPESREMQRMLGFQNQVLRAN